MNTDTEFHSPQRLVGGMPTGPQQPPGAIFGPIVCTLSAIGRTQLLGTHECENDCP